MEASIAKQVTTPLEGDPSITWLVTTHVGEESSPSAIYDTLAEAQEAIETYFSQLT